MNYYIWIFLCGSLFYSCSGSDGEKPDKLLRVERTFNEDWYFILDTLETGEDQGWFHPERIPADIMKVEVPHTWNVMDGTENHYGLGWYFKFFDVPDSWEGKVTRIRFDAIYRDVKIWVNGDLVIERIGAGYTPFEIDLSDHLLFTGNNLMAIQVSNKFSGRAIPVDHKFDWAADGGIIRKVKLIKTESPYILYLHTEPRLKNRDQGDLAIRIGISGHQETGIGALDVWWQIREFKQTSRNIIHEGNRKLDINQDEIVFDLKLDGINRWHFNQPYLYQIKVAIGNKLILTDHAETTFGFRSLTVLDDKILFNGEHVRLPGIEWMPGSNPGQGMAEDTVTMISMLSLLKNTNSVLTRFHWQQDDFIFRWCDENGLLVQEEIPLWQAPFPGQLDVEMRLLANRHLEEMILAHRNHPSIIAWGIGNELSAQNDTIKGFLTELKKQVSTLDSTRLINYVSNTFHHEPDNDGTAIGDMLMWNDYSGLWYDMDGKGLSAEMLPEILIDFNRHIPGKPLIISE
ncbi:MAG: hypothetical protein KFF73_00380, partial [Cyclobacteriaceae bacterium]|nr:hypothetical protein [Cyclobacteriaceae bacterium]